MPTEAGTGGGAAVVGGNVAAGWVEDWAVAVVPVSVGVGTVPVFWLPFWLRSTSQTPKARIPNNTRTRRLIRMGPRSRRLSRGSRSSHSEPA
jgi:hypothetical protein